MMERQGRGRAYGLGLNRDGHIGFAAAYIAVLVTVAAFGFTRAFQQLPALHFPAQERTRPPVAFRAHPEPDPAFPHAVDVYPRLALRKHQEGTVVLALLVLQDGEVGDVQVVKSSGFPQLDAAAQVEAGNWHYLPAVRNGTPVSAQVNVAIHFKLAA
jgi:TonB family protein